MNPDASQQLFVLLLGLTSVGLVVGSVVESGAFVAAGDPPPQVVATEPSEDAPEEPPPAPVDEGSGTALQPHEVVPLGPPDEGSAEPEVVAAAPAEQRNQGVWAPLRTSQESPCLVRVNRATMATSIHRREPRGTEGPFLANGQPIVCFLDFANGTGVSQPITLVWSQNDTGASYLDNVEAGAGSRWRTWTERPLPLDQLGHWTVQVLDSERCLVGEIEFDLVAPTW